MARIQHILPIAAFAAIATSAALPGGRLMIDRDSFADIDSGYYQFSERDMGGANTLTRNISWHKHAPSGREADRLCLMLVMLTGGIPDSTVISARIADYIIPEVNISRTNDSTASVALYFPATWPGSDAEDLIISVDGAGTDTVHAQQYMPHHAYRIRAHIAGPENFTDTVSETELTEISNQSEQ